MQSITKSIFACPIYFAGNGISYVLTVGTLTAAKHFDFPASPMEENTSSINNFCREGGPSDFPCFSDLAENSGSGKNVSVVFF